MHIGTLCYIRNDDKTLMLHRKKKTGEDIHDDLYVALGGKIEPGESPEECNIREVRQESGLLVKNSQLKGILTFSNEGRSFDKIKTQPDWYVFVATEFTGKLKQKCKEGTLEWIATEDLPNLPMWEGDRLFLKWMDRLGIFSGKLRYKDNELMDHKVTFYE